MTASSMGSLSERNFNAKEERKLRKPLIEKRRRERINCSLEQLKGIMVDAYNLDQSKLEKADVLEITVQHMEGLQRGQGPAGPGCSLGLESHQRYSRGYIQCMHEVHNLLLNCPSMDKTLGARLLNHLLKSLPHISAKTVSTSNTSNNDIIGSMGNCSPLPASATHCPLSLPLAAFQPNPLNPQTSPSPPPPPSPSPASPQLSPRSHEATEGSGGGREVMPPSTPNSHSPILHSGLLLPVLPLLIPGGDPSMWRPW
ncbi:hairy-related 8a isoform X2 [Anguilla rostrata]|uniref:hairy-related 8a isoform X3 n=1 Tax=Anguilla anguilla TaxID=7936 RepID=UPI0015A942BC|nr:hairy-related 8a isoform X3 [Anguilla anguilla]